MTPAATLANLTATGDVVTGPGSPVNLVNGLPCACVGDLVSGPVVTGAITMTTAVNFLIKGRPAANLTAVVTGVNPMTGIPMTSALAVCPNVNRMV
ncbi:MAG: PAAR domain-containing protein [Proteobacteria bacterium]|uniref:PAAR domain-containing protein n=1 Tax=Candidatus Avisuccinivibrio stercorigallinarum TaxID=2840704 RepID=A0A9D9DBC6_9GAMM|nr:PAAR domain-containing protein [Candidatus Avisuccinivibrio stercorigallinarum]